MISTVEMQMTISIDAQIAGMRRELATRQTIYAARELLMSRASRARYIDEIDLLKAVLETLEDVKRLGIFFKPYDEVIKDGIRRGTEAAYAHYETKREPTDG